MTLDRQPRIVGRHAFAVVFNPKQLLPAKLDGDGDTGRVRIKGVLNQFLDD